MWGWLLTRPVLLRLLEVEADHFYLLRLGALETYTETAQLQITAVLNFLLLYVLQWYPKSELDLTEQMIEQVLVAMRCLGKLESLGET